MPKLAAIGNIVTNFSIFKMAAVRHLGSLKIQNFNGRLG